MADELVRQAVAQAKSGNKTEARKLATRAIKNDPNNVAAWVVMAQVVNERAKAIDCLQTVLKLEPGHPWATLHLNRLKGGGAPAPAPASSRVPSGRSMDSIKNQLAQMEAEEEDSMADLRQREPSNFDMRIEDLGDFVRPGGSDVDFSGAALDPLAGTDDWRPTTDSNDSFSYNDMRDELDRAAPAPAKRGRGRGLLIVLFLAVFIFFAVVAAGIGVMALTGNLPF